LACCAPTCRVTAPARSSPKTPRSGPATRTRVGPFDAVAARYAIETAGRPDLLAVSHLDQYARAPERQIATAYRYRGTDSDVGIFVDAEDGLIVRLRPSPSPGDLEYQERLTRIVERSEPVYRSLPAGADALLETVETELGVPVGLTSSGPTWRHKATLDRGLERTAEWVCPRMEDQGSQPTLGGTC
jgi:adenylosuccinate synthase